MNTYIFPSFNITFNKFNKICNFLNLFILKFTNWQNLHTQKKCYWCQSLSNGIHWCHPCSHIPVHYNVVSMNKMLHQILKKIYFSRHILCKSFILRRLFRSIPLRHWLGVETAPPCFNYCSFTFFQKDYPNSKEVDHWSYSIHCYSPSNWLPSSLCDCVWNMF